MGRLFQIVYVSTAVAPFGPDELRELLRGSHERNARAGITGLLLYKDAQFMQALEGEESAVVSLFSRINRDSRHHHVIALLREPISLRLFPESLMSFRDLNHEASRNLPGYSEFLNTPLNAESFTHDIPKCQRLLLLFKKNIS
ncbi:MAG TPA: BLUF domain-containing protein [Desulfuromonadaceae bacterium]|nr:BLUF domain-containing protein [Desulfuromonadaceae bacterium]